MPKEGHPYDTVNNYFILFKSFYLKQYNVLIKRVRLTILYLRGLHNLAHAQLEDYFPKTDIAIFTRAVNIVLRQFL